MKNWEILLKKQKEKPNGIFPLVVPNKATNKGKFADFIQFTNSLEEMQYSQTREEIRRTIGALWGVMPLWQADISTSGGLNNEGLQVTVTTRAALKGQRIYDEKIFPWIVKQFGIEDWNLELITPEEKDEMAELQREQLKIQNARAMLDMGFDVEYGEDKEFVFSGEAQKPEQPGSGTPGQSEPGASNASEGNNSLTGSPPTPSIPASKSISINKKVEKIGDKWAVVHCHGPEAGNIISSFNTKEEAEAMHRAIEANKMSFDTDLMKMVQDEIEIIEKSEGVNIITKSDEVEDILKETIYDLNFEGMNTTQSDAVKDYLLKQTEEKISLKTIMKAIEIIAGINKSDAERIARTEYVSVLQNKSREISYAKRDDGTYLYKWTGPEDSRETKICKNIRERTSKGVKMNEIKKIIKEEADPNIYKSERPWTPHINCRHRLIRTLV
jgi:hypothetical protein